MGIYICFIVLMFIVLCYVKKEKYSIADFIAIIILICFSGFRYGIGTDYTMYENMYLNMDTISMSIFRTGVGYYYLTYFLHLLIPNSATVLFFIISALTNIYIYKFCKENSINPGLSVFLYITLGFYTTSFNIFRQMLSVAIVLYSYKFLNTNKYIKYVIFSILAISIHQSAIFVILLIVIFNKLWHKELNAKVMFIVGIIILISYNAVYIFLLKHITSISVYSDSEEYSAGIGTYLQLIIYGILFFIVNLKRKQIIKTNENNLEYINLFNISYIIMMAGIKNTLFMRMANYLSIFIILLIPELYNIYNIKNKKLEKICFYISCIIYFLVFIYSFGGVVPYESIFTK